MGLPLREVGGFSNRAFVPAASAARITPGRDPADRVGEMLDDFFVGKTLSFRECYVFATGDKRVTGLIRECAGGAMREALDSTSWSAVLGDAMTRRMVAEYERPNQYGVWRTGVKVVPANDFRVQHRVRYGGYGDLPIVAEKDPYLALTSPTDEDATYAIEKRGGTEQITIEMIRNDDVDAIRRIPVKLGQAANRTLSHFVLDFVRTNPPIYDNVALFDNAHNNLGSADLSAAALAAGRSAMGMQPELGSNDPLGLTPRYLWVPPALEEVGFNLFRRGTNLDRTFLQSQPIEVAPVWYWTGDDWAISADPAYAPGIEIAFLDGDENPRLDLQDNPSVGSLFSNDQITYRIRHIFGGAVVDCRSWYKSVPT
jgi:hypothetical protein